MNPLEQFIHFNYEDVSDFEDKILHQMKSGARLSLLIDVLDNAEASDFTVALTALLCQDSTKDTHVESILRDVMMKAIRNYAGLKVWLGQEKLDAARQEMIRLRNSLTEDI